MGQREVKKPKYTHGFVDRLGKPRFYFRREGHAAASLPGLPWSREFMAAYEACMNAKTDTAQIGAARTMPGTINAAIISYVQSGAFLALGDGTRKSRRAILERFREEHGEKRAALLRTENVQFILATLRPYAARNWLKALRGFCRYCVAVKAMASNPCADVDLGRLKSRAILD